MAGIIIGFDDSRCARSALDAAIDIGLRLGEPLVVAFAYGPPSRISGEEYGAHSKALQEIGSNARRKRSRARRGRSRGRDGAPPRTARGGAQRARRAPRRADDRRRHVRGAPLRSAILGSTPHKLLHLTERPVLCVPLPELRR